MGGKFSAAASLQQHGPSQPGRDFCSTALRGGWLPTSAPALHTGKNQNTHITPTASFLCLSHPRDPVLWI